ncbi:MAG: Dna2/Cas4 domain-containing protein [Caldilineae bacterium]|nr:MAG: Dna2/Cas4 domain-containing protein [Caldilineae bacterium]
MTRRVPPVPSVPSVPSVPQSPISQSPISSPPPPRNTNTPNTSPPAACCLLSAPKEPPMNTQTPYLPNPPRWLCEVTEEPVTVAACLACARERRQPSCPFNVALLKALAAANEPDAAISGLHQTGYPVLRVSSLTGCVRKSWYSLRAERRLETPSQHWARLRGAIFHHALENMGEGHIERRLTAFLYDQEAAAFITGRIDGFSPERNELVDYKSTRRLPGNVRPHHHRQVLLYAWLLARNGFGPPRTIRLIYISMAKVKSFDVPPPTPAELAELETNLLVRVRRILADEPPEPTPEETWECKYCPFSECPAQVAGGGTAAGSRQQTAGNV